MIDNEQRVLELTRALEDLLEAFHDAGDSWQILTDANTFVAVHSDVDPLIEHCMDILYNEEDRDDYGPRFYAEL